LISTCRSRVTSLYNIYTLSLHDALPIYHQPDSERGRQPVFRQLRPGILGREPAGIEPERRLAGPGSHRHQSAEEDLGRQPFVGRSEEHTSELQSQSNLVCRLLLEKKKKK